MIKRFPPIILSAQINIAVLKLHLISNLLEPLRWRDIWNMVTGDLTKLSASWPLHWLCSVLALSARVIASRLYYPQFSKHWTGRFREWLTEEKCTMLYQDVRLTCRIKQLLYNRTCEHLPAKFFNSGFASLARHHHNWTYCANALLCFRYENSCKTFTLKQKARHFWVNLAFTCFVFRFTSVRNWKFLMSAFCKHLSVSCFWLPPKGENFKLAVT